MSTRNIEHDRWESFLKDFTRQHQGWLVSIEVLRPDLGAQMEAHNVPLREILYEHKGASEAVLIMAGNEQRNRLTHTIETPRQIFLLEKESGTHEALDIRDAEGGNTIIKFRSSLPPETLDGITGSEYAGGSS